MNNDGQSLTKGITVGARSGSDVSLSGSDIWSDGDTLLISGVIGRDRLLRAGSSGSDILGS